MDKIGENRVILLGKSNIPKRNGSYESFGGKYEKEDIDIFIITSIIIFTIF